MYADYVIVTSPRKYGSHLFLRHRLVSLWCVTSHRMLPPGKLRLGFATLPSAARPAMVKNYSDKFLVSGVITLNVILVLI